MSLHQPLAPPHQDEDTSLISDNVETVSQDNHFTDESSNPHGLSTCYGCCPAWGWECYAGVSCVVYITAIFGMTGFNNYYAAAGWGVTAVNMLMLYLFYRNERRTEPMRCPLRAEDKHNKTAASSSNGSSTQTTTIPMKQGQRRLLPFYVTWTALSVIFTLLSALCALDTYWCYQSISADAPLNGGSLWMAFISWTMAVKTESQLLCALYRGRTRWQKRIIQNQQLVLLQTSSV